MGKKWDHDQRKYIEQTEWCPQCRSVHTLLVTTAIGRICHVSKTWREAHQEELLQEWRIQWAWRDLYRSLRQQDATRRRLDAPMHTVACPDCHTRYQSYDSIGTRCGKCSMERE